MIINKLSLLITGGLLLAANSMSADVLSPQEALSRAAGHGMSRVFGEKASPKLVHTEKAQNGDPAVYVFSGVENRGFMILSANDIAFPVLGYSDENIADEANMPPQLLWWLGKYAQQIEDAQAAGVKAAQSAVIKSSSKSWDPILPLVSTKWNQDSPYNDMCPVSNGRETYTGCVATSMAQVMNYFKYPEIGQGKIMYKATGINKTLMMKFDAEPFVWDKMRDSYTAGDYTAEEGDAVAYLMKACGYSIEMEYGTNASGAMSYLVPNALIEYFKYDESVKYVSRSMYSSDDWTAMIYDNLKNIGPVIYDGTAPSQGGHSFVCDGYDGNGYFHFNWGWGGVSDGYYSLDALNPDAQGIGGYVGGFNTDQDIVIGIKKPDGIVEEEPGRLFQYGSSIATLEGDAIIFGSEGEPFNNGWGNKSNNTIKVELGASITKLGDNTFEPLYVSGYIGNMNVVSIEPNRIYAYNPGKVYYEVKVPVGLSDGVYKVMLVSKDMNTENAEWLPVLVNYGYSNYAILDVVDGKYSVSDVARAILSFKDVEITTGLYYNRNALLKSIVVNDTDYQLSQPVIPCLYRNGEKQYVGECVLITVNPFDTLEKEWVVKFYKNGTSPMITSPTEFTLTLENPVNGDVFGEYGTVTVQPSPGTPTIAVNEFEIVGSPLVETEVYEGYSRYVNIVSDPENFDVNVDIEVIKGYMDNTLVIAIEKLDKNNPSVRVPVDELFRNVMFLNTGENWSDNIKIDFMEAKNDEFYYLSLKYVSGYSYKTLKEIMFRVSDPNSVGIVNDDNDSCEYYNMQGVRVDNPSKGQMLIKKYKNSVSKIVF